MPIQATDHGTYDEIAEAQKMKPDFLLFSVRSTDDVSSSRDPWESFRESPGSQERNQASVTGIDAIIVDSSARR